MFIVKIITNMEYTTATEGKNNHQVLKHCMLGILDERFVKVEKKFVQKFSALKCHLHLISFCCDQHPGTHIQIIHNQ